MFNKQTTLDLGGPKLGFTTDPQNLTVNTGTGATFFAIGTATYDVNIPAQFATNTGIITFRWYVDDAQVRFDTKRDALLNQYVAQKDILIDKVEQLKKYMDNKLQRALDNPLAK